MRILLSLALGAVLPAANALAQTTVLASGLKNPMKVIMTPGGNLLVSEVAEEKDASRVSLVERSGARRTLLDGLPSAVDSGGSLSGPHGMALSGRILYLAIGGGDSAVEDPPKEFPNPHGVASPIFCTILRIRFSADIDRLTSAFTFKPADATDVADGSEVTLSNGSGGQATIDALTVFRFLAPDTETVYRHSNPYGLALSPDSKTLYMADSGRNMVVKIDTATGRPQRLATFDPVPNPNSDFGPPVMDAVPDSVRMFGDKFLLVSLLPGFPFTAGTAKIMAIDLATGQKQLFINGLTNAIDVLSQEGSGRFFVLELTPDLLSASPGPGRVLVYDSPEGRQLAGDLAFPTSMAQDPATGDLFVTELGTGRLIQIRTR